MQIRQHQYEQLTQATLERQAREIAIRFAQEVEEHDPDLAARTLSYSRGDEIEFLDRLLNLTNVEQYQKCLLFIFLQTGINFFREDLFKYILDHPLLSGNAKARHIAVSSFVILEGRT
ncbi:MAG TPA: hypothetical protein VN844_12990 [Pyrinomonadaceae bacterium]|nr:hypothetical protein [Pyrinomonadaceae bacterium]